VDTLQGTKLQPMPDELGFWAYRVDNAFPPDMHDRLVTLMTQSFDPIKWVSEVMHISTERSNVISTTMC